MGSFKTQKMARLGLTLPVLPRPNGTPDLSGRGTCRTCFCRINPAFRCWYRDAPARLASGCEDFVFGAFLEFGVWDLEFHVRLSQESGGLEKRCRVSYSLLR